MLNQRKQNLKPSFDIPVAGDSVPASSRTQSSTHGRKPNSCRTGHPPSPSQHGSRVHHGTMHRLITANTSRTQQRSQFLLGDNFFSPPTVPEGEPKVPPNKAHGPFPPPFCRNAAPSQFAPAGAGGAERGCPQSFRLLRRAPPRDLPSEDSRVKLKEKSPNSPTMALGDFRRTISGSNTTHFPDHPAPRSPRSPSFHLQGRPGRPRSRKHPPCPATATPCVSLITAQEL